MRFVTTNNDMNPTGFLTMTHGPLRMPSRFGPGTLLATLALILLPLVGSAQTTTGGVRGTVTAEDGSPLAGAVVTATNESTGLARSSLTNEDGRYMVMLLPTGDYTVRVDILGYQSGEATAVEVDAGNNSVANFVLPIQVVELEGIAVTANPAALDVTSGSVTQMVQRAEIEALPSLGRDFTNYITLSGLVAPDPGTTTGGKFSIAGQRASQTSIQIDGVDANNAFFGENRGGSRIPFVFSLESIDEFEIITNGYDIEYGQYSGGIVNVVTRGGGNEFEGTAYLNYRGDAFTSTGFDDIAPNDYSVTQFAGRISGPFIRDKLFYLFSLDGQIRREPQAPVSAGYYGPGGQAENPTVAAEVERFQDILENNYGINDAASGYQRFNTSNDIITLFGRLDWTINDEHRLSVRHNYAHHNNESEWNPNFDFIYGESRAEDLLSRSHSFVSELQSVFNDQTYNVLRFQIADERRPRSGRELRPALIVNLSDNQQIGYGGTFASFNNNLEETKFELIDHLTLVRGNHTLKFGGGLLYTNILNQFIIRGSGDYRFNSLDEFEAFQPSFFTRNIYTGGDIPLSKFDVMEGSLSVQDEWAINRNLTATFGLRYDVGRFLDDPPRIVDVESAFGFPTGLAPNDDNNISPRVALAWDVNADGRSVVRAGAGYFYGRTPYVLGGNVLQTDRPQVTVNCGGSILDGDPDAPPPVTPYSGWSSSGWDNPRVCAGGPNQSGVPGYTFWQPDFEYPETFKANLGYAQELFSGTQVSVDLLFSESTNLYTVRNINLRDAQFQLAGEEGRRVFKPEGEFDPTTSGSPVPSYLNTDFAPVYVNYNDGRARTFAATFEVVQPLFQTTTLRGSYTYTNSYDNSSYSCCTASSGHGDPTVGAYGPNDIGGIGDKSRAWGPSDFMRTHTFIIAGNTQLPYGFSLSGSWRIQSGQPFTPEMQGDVNGDGVNYNDRPFIFAPEDLPLASAGTPAEAEEREAYRDILARNSCLGDYVGQIVPRGTCRMPRTNQLDLRIQWEFPSVSGQRGAVQLDLFNVLNGINNDWGRWMGVFGSDRNLLVPVEYDSVNNRVLYEVYEDFGRESVRGANLLLQFQAQLGFRYYF